MFSLLKENKQAVDGTFEIEFEVNVLPVVLFAFSNPALSSNRMYAVIPPDTNKIVFAIHTTGDGADYHFTSNDSLEINRRYKLVITKLGATISIYLDGVLQS